MVSGEGRTSRSQKKISYTTEFKASARKDLLALDDRTYERVQKALDGLQNNPRPPDSRKIHGAKHSYRIRVGDYRALYEVDDPAHLVTVYRIRHRREAYR